MHGALHSLSWMLGEAEISAGLAAIFQLKSPFAFFGLALAAGSRGF